MLIDGRIFYPLFMPHGFMAATKMFRVLTAWLERAALKVFSDAIKDPKRGKELKENTPRTNLESKFIKERIDAITRPGLSESDAEYTSMLAERITTKINLSGEERRK